MSKKIDLTGKRFSRLVVIKDSGERTSKGEVVWFCKCDCGKETIIRGTYLTRGVNRSCGCFRDEESSRRRKESQRPPKICIHPDCSLTTEKGAWGYCSKHYTRLRNHGDANYVTPKEVAIMKLRLSMLSRNTGKEKGYKKFYGKHEHRFLGEEIAGRKLLKIEHVHHVDENKKNNKKSNLKIMTAQEHARHHNKK